MAGGRKRRERGVALVTVMALIASIGVLVASAVAISQYSAAETDTLASLQRSALEAESAANRTLCLLLVDRAKNADRRLGAETDGAAERFLADGTEHTVTAGERTVSVRIFDAVAGLDLAGRNPARQLTNPKLAKDEPREELIARPGAYAFLLHFRQKGPRLRVPVHRLRGHRRNHRRCRRHDRLHQLRRRM